MDTDAPGPGREEGHVGGLEYRDGDIERPDVPAVAKDLHMRRLHEQPAAQRSQLDAKYPRAMALGCRRGSSGRTMCVRTVGASP